LENNIELIPDKDGFLFEIEDKMYLVTQIFIIGLFSALFLRLFYLADFSLTNLYEHGRLGRLVIVFSIPIYLYYIVKTLYYVLIQKRKIVKFYETHILFSNNFSIILADIKKMYRLKLNMIWGGKGRKFTWYKKTIRFINSFPFWNFNGFPKCIYSLSKIIS
jgi:hypothetical protein